MDPASALPNERNLFNKILIGLDMSDQTDLVIEVAAGLVNKLGADAEVVTVVNVPTNSAGNEMDGTPANNQEIRLREELLSHLSQYFSEESKVSDVKVLHGDPAQRISEFADYCNCDLIVVGSRSQGALRKAILGSVSSSIAARSKKSVLIVK